MIRQGDILFMPVEADPPDGVISQPRIILAEGEATGHLHIAEGPAILQWSIGEQRYIRVVGSKPGTIAHPQHDLTPAPVLKPDVTYKVVRQQTLNLADEWENVRD